jgi:hypothetical protein
MRINGKDYRIPELGFGTVRRLEGYGISLFDVSNSPSKRIFSIYNAFACITLNIEPEQADFLLEQHLLGGGTFDGWIEEINKAVESSGFFQSMMKKSQKKVPIQKAEATPIPTE